MQNDKKQCSEECITFRFQKRSRLFAKWLLKHIYTIIHILVLAALSWYILSNWESCISMQFFSDFDGNNILFLAWIVLIFLLVYEVEGKGIKVAKRKQEESQKNLDIANHMLQLDNKIIHLEEENSKLPNTVQELKGGSENGLQD